MRILLVISLVMAVVGVVMWISELQRRLRAAQMRGDMYRDISARLDRRLAELTNPQTAPGA